MMNSRRAHMRKRIAALHAEIDERVEYYHARLAHLPECALHEVTLSDIDRRCDEIESLTEKLTEPTFTETAHGQRALRCAAAGLCIGGALFGSYATFAIGVVIAVYAYLGQGAASLDPPLFRSDPPLPGALPAQHGQERQPRRCACDVRHDDGAVTVQINPSPSCPSSCHPERPTQPRR
jgi:hypothetical protein